jgi:hypothetical protein
MSCGTGSYNPDFSRCADTTTARLRKTEARPNTASIINILHVSCNAGRALCEKRFRHATLNSYQNDLRLRSVRDPVLDARKDLCKWRSISVQ